MDNKIRFLPLIGFVAALINCSGWPLTKPLCELPGVQFLLFEA